jgi:hypothetical protein
MGMVVSPADQRGHEAALAVEHGVARHIAKRECDKFVDKVGRRNADRR